jgi:hypothetical protein
MSGLAARELETITQAVITPAKARKRRIERTRVM